MDVAGTHPAALSNEMTLSMSATSVVMEAAMEPSKSTASACQEMCPKLE